MKRALLSWSSGKDSAWSLYLLQQEYHVVGLLTTINEAFDRVAIHAVRRVLLEAQAKAVGVPLWPVPLPWPCSNANYQTIMAATCAEARQAGIEVIAFGDLFLREIREYRETQLKDTGLEPIFPLWGSPTLCLAREMIAAGLRAVLTCIDPMRLSARFVGRDFDEALLSELPPSVDPCGENGEFHSFAYAGPVFRHSIEFRVGQIAERDGYVFADLEPNACGKGSSQGASNRLTNS
jgi:uncharacterized protein (TIGR00290 family)